MSREFLDVVDRRDVVIDRRRRDEVHRLSLKHRAVHTLVFNSRGELFLQKRSWLKDTFPGAWDSSAAGHLNCGEGYDHGAVRELEEELGVRPAGPLDRLFKINACEATGQEFVWVYRCCHDGPFVLPPEEIERGGWFSPEYVAEWLVKRPEDFASALRLIWAMSCERGLV